MRRTSANEPARECAPLAPDELAAPRITASLLNASF
jgi:hypothetical protein